MYAQLVKDVPALFAWDWWIISLMWVCVASYWKDKYKVPFWKYNILCVLLSWGYTCFWELMHGMW